MEKPAIWFFHYVLKHTTATDMAASRFCELWRWWYHFIGLFIGKRAIGTYGMPDDLVKINGTAWTLRFSYQMEKNANSSWTALKSTAWFRQSESMACTVGTSLVKVHTISFFHLCTAKIVAYKLVRKIVHRSLLMWGTCVNIKNKKSIQVGLTGTSRRPLGDLIDAFNGL